MQDLPALLMDLLAPQVLPVPQVQMEQMELRALLAPPVLRELLALREDLQVLVEPLEPLELLEPQVVMETMERMGQLGLQVSDLRA